MSSGQSQPKEKLPSDPAPQSGYYYQNGVLQASDTYNPSQGAYDVNSYLNPDQLSTFNQANTGMSSVLNQAGSALGDLGPGQIQQYAQDYAQPQIDALTNQYNQTLGSATNAANANGTLGSVGFDNYLSNQLARNQAQGLADIQANAQTQALNVPNEILSPYMNLYNLYSGAAGGQQANMMSNINPATSSQQNAQNAAQQQFMNQLSLFQTAQPYQESFMGRLFGGY